MEAEHLYTSLPDYDTIQVYTIHHVNTFWGGRSLHIKDAQSLRALGCWWLRWLESWSPTVRLTSNVSLLQSCLRCESVCCLAPILLPCCPDALCCLGLKCDRMIPAGYM